MWRKIRKWLSQRASKKKVRHWQEYLKVEERVQLENQLQKEQQNILKNKLQ